MNGRATIRIGGILAAMTAALSLAASAGAAERIGTYNIRYDNPGDRRTGNAWAQRAPVVAGLIRFHDFDVVGTQEGFKHQVDDLRALLPEHECSAHGRDDGAGKGEQIAIFYKKEHYERLDAGCFWLSETPDRPSVGWDASLPRICGWTKLRSKAAADDGEAHEPFFVFSVHFDHRGETARQQSARLVLSKVDEIAGKAAAFLVGDFNAPQGSPTHLLLEDSPRFKNAFDAAGFRFALNGTANRFDPASMTESRIDHVFVPEARAVRMLGILTDTYRAPRQVDRGGEASGNFPKEVRFEDFETKLPSDHFPVLAELE